MKINAVIKLTMIAKIVPWDGRSFFLSPALNRPFFPKATDPDNQSSGGSQGAKVY